MTKPRKSESLQNRTLTGAWEKRRMKELRWRETRPGQIAVYYSGGYWYFNDHKVRKRSMKHLLAFLLCWTIQVTSPMRVIDGDTFVADIPIWHNTFVRERVRVLDVDAKESGEEGGPAATAFTTAWLQKGPFQMMTCKRDSFGRILAFVTRGSESLADALTDAGHTKKKPEKPQEKDVKPPD